MAEKEEKSSKKPEKTETKTKSPKKSNKGLLFGIIGGVLVLAAAIAAFVLIKPGAKPDDPKAKLSYSSSFFISDNGTPKESAVRQKNMTTNPNSSPATPTSEKTNSQASSAKMAPSLFRSENMALLWPTAVSISPATATLKNTIS